MELKIFAAKRFLDGQDELLDYVLADKDVPVEVLNKSIGDLLDSDEVAGKLVSENYVDYLKQQVPVGLISVGDNEFDAIGAVNDRVLELVSKVHGVSPEDVVKNLVSGVVSEFHGDRAVEIGDVELGEGLLPPLAAQVVSDKNVVSDSDQKAEAPVEESKSETVDQEREEEENSEAVDQEPANEDGSVDESNDENSVEESETVDQEHVNDETVDQDDGPIPDDFDLGDINYYDLGDDPFDDVDIPDVDDSNIPDVASELGFDPEDVIANGGDYGFVANSEDVEQHDDQHDVLEGDGPSETTDTVRDGLIGAYQDFVGAIKKKNLDKRMDLEGV